MQHSSGSCGGQDCISEEGQGPSQAQTDHLPTGCLQTRTERIPNVSPGILNGVRLTEPLLFLSL